MTTKDADAAIERLPLVEEGDVAGYALGDIERALGSGLWLQFQEWLAGQTQVRLQGRWCVYPWDLARFVRRERANRGVIRADRC